MTGKEESYDNAFAETLFSRFKAELLDGGLFYGLDDARTRVFEYIESYYNTIRKHSSIGYLIPKQFEEQLNPDYALENLFRAEMPVNTRTCSKFILIVGSTRFRVPIPSKFLALALVFFGFCNSHDDP